MQSARAHFGSCLEVDSEGVDPSKGTRGRCLTADFYVREQSVDRETSAFAFRRPDSGPTDRANPLNAVIVYRRLQYCEALADDFMRLGHRLGASSATRRQPFADSSRVLLFAFARIPSTGQHVPVPAIAERQ